MEKNKKKTIEQSGVRKGNTVCLHYLMFSQYCHCLLFNHNVKHVVVNTRQAKQLITDVAQEEPTYYGC